MSKSRTCKPTSWENYRGPWGEPRRADDRLYPGLVLDDNVVSGSITAGYSRLPLWAMTFAIRDVQESLEKQWDDLHGWNAEQFSSFIHELLQMRGEFGRLLLILANAERQEGIREERGEDIPWWAHGPSRKRIAAQLRKCLEIIIEEPA